LGWRANEESFLSGVDEINELKLRGSYGVTGNFEIPNYGAIGLLSGANYVSGTSQINGVAPSTSSNADLTWETSYQMNVGVDYALLNDRIYGSIDYYTTTTEDLLLFVTVPAASGFDVALTNIGEVENKGFEFSMTSRNMVGPLNWATDFNFAANQNTVTKLGPEGDDILSSGAAGARHITRIGDAIGSYYGYVVDGIYQSQAEIDAAPVDRLVGSGGARPGDFRFKDINGDGEITSDDRTVTGSYHPDYTFGITNRFEYKNFDFNIFVQGVMGREVLNLTARHLKNGEANFGSYAVLNDRWISESNPGNGEHPRADRSSASHGNNNRPSSYQVEDGSYVKIKNLSFGYTLPDEFLNGAFSRARIYTAMTNVAIFTDYVGFNPEVNLQANSSLTPGEDYGAYPLSRTIQVGIDLAF
jgi:TonB-linked SusC/RagA family outer membrane protein